MTALFLLIVVGALGAVSVRLTADQQQYGTLELTQMRATTAANAGLEYWSNRVFTDSNDCDAFVDLDLGSFHGFEGFTVRATCTQIRAGADNVYELTSSARAGAYGSPDFVQRRVTRRISTLGSGTW